MSSKPLPNYLETHRLRMALSQKEVAYLLGFRGDSRGSKVSQHEGSIHEPSLRTALAYEALYQRPIRELFPGLYAEIEEGVTARAKVMSFRKDWKPGKKTDYKRQVLTEIASRKSTNNDK